MWKTIILLVVTILIVPFLAFKFDQVLSPLQWEILTILLKVYLGAATLCFVISSVTKNYSQVDKLWSILPMVYVWIVCVKAGFEPRLMVMSILVTIWGVRLSYNFARRGGYSLKFWSGEEDYRWAILQTKPEFQPSWKWMLFNLFFISLYQLGLILLFTLPILKSVGGTPLSWVDYILAVLFFTLVVIESIADQQQWTYQKKKHQLLRDDVKLYGKYTRGFVREGLWRFVRHPNYSAEQAIWLVFYFFSVSATGLWINWTLSGSLLLILLFKGSSDFSEEITAKKYPEYSEYQKEVPRFLPIK